MNLPREIVDHIFKFTDFNTCVINRNYSVKHFFSDKKSHEYFIRNYILKNDLYSLQFLKNNGFKFKKNIKIFACFFNNFDIFSYINDYENELTLNEKNAIFYRACYNKNIQFIKYLYEVYQDYVFPKNSLEYCLKNNSLEIFNFLTKVSENFD